MNNGRITYRGRENQNNAFERELPNFTVGGKGSNALFYVKNNHYVKNDRNLYNGASAIPGHP